MLRAALAVLAILWLAFLARGRTRGGVKRLLLRLTLLAIAAGLVAAATARGLFERSTPGFRVALLLALLVVEVGYLYSIRFCGDCGRMVRNLKVHACPRCGAKLPRHGMTAAPPLPRSDDGGPRASLPRRRRPLP